MITGIFPVFGGVGNGVKLDLTAGSDVLPSGSIVEVVAGNVKVATAATDKTKVTYLCTEDTDYATRVNKDVEVLSTKGFNAVVFRNFTDGTLAKSDIGTKCGLNATGNAIDKTNATELVEITDVVTVGGVQEVYFKFI